ASLASQDSRTSFGLPLFSLWTNKPLDGFRCSINFFENNRPPSSQQRCRNAPTNPDKADHKYRDCENDCTGHNQNNDGWNTKFIPKKPLLANSHGAPPKPRVLRRCVNYAMGLAGERTPDARKKFRPLC